MMKTSGHRTAGTTETGHESFRDEQHSEGEDASSDIDGSSVGRSESMNFGSSSNPDHTNSNSSSNEDSRPGIAKDETAAVFRLRVVVIVVLIITAALVSTVVLRITQAGENDELRTQYDGAAYVVQTAFHSVVEELSVISALGVVEPSDSHSTGFPFETLHNFNKRAANARFMTGALSISYCPIVTIDKREQWEAYVNAEDSSWM